MASQFPLDEAQIVGLFMESTFYGIYLVSFSECIRVLFSQGKTASKTKVNKTLLVVALAMGTFATLDIAFGLRHVLDAFIFYRGPGGPIQEFEDISYWVNVMKTVDYVIQTLIGDLMLIYRCYVVFGRRWIVTVLPLTIWTGTLICGSIVIYISFHLKVSTNLDEKHLVPFITSTLVLTLVQNVATTCFIAYRIWSIDRRICEFKMSSRGKIRPIVRIIVESGAIYTSSLVVFLAVYLCSNNSQYPISDCIVQIIGIVFNMIIIRVHQGRTADQEVTSTMRLTSNSNSRGTFSSGHPVNSLGKAQSHSAMSDQAYPMQPVQVNVMRHIDTDDESAFVRSEGNVEAK